VIFVESAAFTKRLADLLDDDSYGALQNQLSLRPDAGALIVHGGGLRKIRWMSKGQSKRGGVRVIYYWETAAGVILMLSIYAKNEKENLSQKELEELRRQIGK
jgi:hypothetical protein